MDTPTNLHENENDAAATELAELFASRANFYGLLASFFLKELTWDQINELKNMQFPTNSGNEALDAGFAKLYNYLSGAWEGSVSDLAIDYARTFIGSGVSGYSAAYLYESVHTSERRLLGREARGEVLQFYRDAGLVKGKWNDMEDHLGVELEFMQILSSRTHDALAANETEAALELVRVQRDFVRDHLNNWVPLMAADAAKFAQTDFYKGAVLVLQGYCKDDEALLEEMLDESEND